MGEKRLPSITIGLDGQGNNIRRAGPNGDFIRRISFHVMNIFMKTVSISNGLISPVVYIGNTKNGYHLSGS